MVSPEQISHALDRVLPFVQKPARYTGGEFNSIVKPWDDTAYRLALVFPDVYDLGMSNLGLMILYDLVNKQPDMLAERAYTPWRDMIDAMRREDIPLYALESRRPLFDFDVIGISLAYEQLYTNVLTTLHLAGIPLRSQDRLAETQGTSAKQWPLILAGGSACLNPEPMHAFFDAFFMGEGEEAISEIVRAWTDVRRAGASRVEGLRRIATIEGVYVPSFYEAVYHPAGRLAGTKPKPEYADVAPATVAKRIVSTLPPPVTDFIVPFIDIVHNRAAVEIQRGCTRGCRFCQAGMIFRPVRERPADEVLAAVDRLVSRTGFEEVSLLSLSSSDHSEIEKLVTGIVDRHGGEKLSVGLPSLRIESVSVDLMSALAGGRRRSGFTFAPEAATDRLRDVINKPIATQAMLDTAREVYSRGWPTIKLYFMIGHPTQTLEDVEAIADLAHQVRRIGFELLGKKSNVRVGVSTLVPKPHTPFQWLPVADEATIWDQIKLLQQRLRGPGMHFNWNNPKETLLEAALSRGDRRLSDVIERAWELGAAFDGWGDQFRAEVWAQAFAERASFADSGQQLDAEWHARRERLTDEVLPWDHISVGVKKQFLIREYEHALAEQTIGDCRHFPVPIEGENAKCYACGILAQFRDQRREVAEIAWGCPGLPSTRGVSA